MTQVSDSGRLTKYAKARDLSQLVMAVSLVPALMAAYVYFAPERLWGRPVSIEVLMAGYMTAVGGPAMAMLLYGLLVWLAKTASAGIADVPSEELFLYRTLSTVFGSAPMILGLVTLTAWYGAGSELPDTWLYFSCGLQLLAFMLALVAVVVFSRRRQRDAKAQITR